MSDDPPKPPPLAVPSGRAARFGQFGRLAAGVGGGMLAEGARRLASGRRPRMSDLLLTPANIGRLADRMSRLRGAAMKLGQMISMDAGELLPPELAEVMATLRDNAHQMPPRQLQQVLSAQWGSDWRSRFNRFDARPVAAASIGQVHRAITHDGRVLAIKVQYPGIRESIDADVDNVAALLRISGLLPDGLNMTPLLTEAKRQLAEEADYQREGAQIEQFGRLLADDPDFVVPVLDREFTTDRVLAMSYLEGHPIEALVSVPQATRDRVAASLISLVLRELFAFGVMQTDPNFANFRFQPDSGKLVLLDFGAVRAVAPETRAAYRRLLQALLDSNHADVRSAALDSGFIGQHAMTAHRARVDRMIEIIEGALHQPGRFDFGDRAFVTELRDHGLSIAADRKAWHLPPADLLFVQRKISGTALLAARLEARVNLRSLIGEALVLPA